MKNTFKLLLIIFFTKNILPITLTTETYIELIPGNEPIKIVISEKSLSEALNGITKSTLPITIGLMLTISSAPMLMSAWNCYKINTQNRKKNYDTYAMLLLSTAFFATGAYLLYDHIDLSNNLIKYDLYKR